MRKFVSGTTYTREDFRYYIALWICQNRRPYIIVLDLALRQVFRMLNSKVAIPSNVTVKNDIRKLWKLSVERVRAVLAVSQFLHFNAYQILIIKLGVRRCRSHGIRWMDGMQYVCILHPQPHSLRRWRGRRVFSRFPSVRTFLICSHPSAHLILVSLGDIPDTTSLACSLTR